MSACDVSLLIKKCQNEVDPDEKPPHLWSSLPKTLSLSIFFALFGWYHLSTIDKFVPWCEKYSNICRRRHHFWGKLLPTIFCLSYWCTKTICTFYLFYAHLFWYILHIAQCELDSVVFSPSVIRAFIDTGFQQIVSPNFWNH